MDEAADPLEVTPADGYDLDADIEAVADRAKRSFSLADRLRGVRLATAKVLIFTDLDAAEEWNAAKATSERLSAFAAAMQREDPSAKETREAVDDMTRAEKAEAAARERAFAGALAIHMRAVPQVAFEAAERKARRAFADDSGAIPQESQSAFYAQQNDMLLGQVITRIVDADGQEWTFERKRIAAQLREALPVPQWSRVFEAFNRLMFNDNLARAATAEPGF